MCDHPSIQWHLVRPLVRRLCCLQMGSAGNVSHYQMRRSCFISHVPWHAVRPPISPSRHEKLRTIDASHANSSPRHVKPVKTVMEDCSRTKYLQPSEAVEYGLI